MNCINLGPIESRMMNSIEEGASPGAAAAVHDGFAATIPMQRYGTPDEVAGVVAFLASEDAAYVARAAYTVEALHMTPEQLAVVVFGLAKGINPRLALC